MNKQTLAILLSGIFACSAQAEECAFDGFYAGAGVGGSFSSAQIINDRSASLNLPGVLSFTAATNTRAQGKKNAFEGEVFAGYGFGWDPVYLGLEVYVKGAKAKTRIKETATFQMGNPANQATFTLSPNTYAKINSVEPGIDLRPGAFITPATLLYARVGMAFNRLTVHSSLNLAATAPAFFAGTVTAPVTQWGRKNTVGFRLGGGLEHQFCENWAIRADYVFTRYGTSKITSTLPAPLAGGATGNILSISSAKFITHSVLLGLSYYW